jgi:phosphoribosylamine--glycine ligase
MHILLIGSGGREHALAWKITQSKHCTKLSIAPGNSGTANCGTNVPVLPTDFDGIGKFCSKEHVDMVIVGPEEPLVNGLFDFFQNNPALKPIHFIGPSQAGATLEGSKAWAKQFMHRHAIPTAQYREFNSSQLKDGLAYLNQHSLPIVLKADGLAAGKGVVICNSLPKARKALREILGGQFGDAGNKVVVEAFLNGTEFSVFVLTDGVNYRVLPEAKDYKRAGEKDKGPNTGGMGAVSPVPFLTPELWEKIEKTIIEPTIKGLQLEKITYRGFIFFGLMLVADEPFVIEYNCRLGDPETEVVIPRLKNDLVKLLTACATGSLKRTTIKTNPKAAATIMLVSGGYPGSFEKSKAISGLESVHGSIPFHAAIREENNQLLTNGGRVLAITSLGKTLRSALSKSRKYAKIIHFEGKFYRRDIGKDVL